MSGTVMEERILVKDVMTSPVITINENACVPLVAQLMEQHNVGCIVVTSKDGKPLGIITERDLVTRVLAKITEDGLVSRVLKGDVQPGRLTAGEMMTSPLITVDPNENLSEATRRMSRLNIRRLGVMYKGNLVGIVSSKDILAVTPSLILILQEQVRTGRVAVDEVQEQPPLAGYCDQCGNWSYALKDVEGNFLCKECQIELKLSMAPRD